MYFFIADLHGQNFLLKMLFLNGPLAEELSTHSNFERVLCDPTLRRDATAVLKL
jgi:hypothetical protein